MGATATCPINPSGTPITFFSKVSFGEITALERTRCPGGTDTLDTTHNTTRKTTMMDLIKRLAVEEDGADATEYALLASLVAVALIVGATALGTKINDVFSSVQNKMTVAS